LSSDEQKVVEAVLLRMLVRLFLFVLLCSAATFLPLPVMIVVRCGRMTSCTTTLIFLFTQQGK
jgi:hypothetical protein